MGDSPNLIQTYRKDLKYPVNIGYSLRPTPPQSIIVHTTNGRKGSSFENEALFLRDNNIIKDSKKGIWLIDDDGVSANYLIGKDGKIAEIVPPQYAAWHSGKCFNPLFENPNSIGIEVHYTPGEGAWTTAMWQALTELVRMLMERYDITQRNIEMHRITAKPKGRKIDPSGISDVDFYAWRNNLTTPTAVRTIGSYTKDTLLVGAAPAIDPAWVVDFICKNRKPVYPRRNEGGDASSDNVERIVHLYAQTASSVGLDWWLVFCQMCHETGRLTSWWCSPPRRNPAGIGVTGARSDVQPPAGAWEYHEQERKWKAGYRFATWEAAVNAHVAHLLCYVYTDSEMTPELFAFSHKSPRRAFIPVTYRGSAKTIAGLTQRWAWSKVLPPEGERYHNRIVTLANSL